MKYFFLALGLACSALPAAGQQKIDRSVFAGHERAPLNKEAYSTTAAAVKAQFPGWNMDIDKFSGMLNDVYGPAIAVTGGTNAERAANLMDTKLKAFGINKAEWATTRDEVTRKAGFVDYSQVIDGHTVAFSRLGFRFTLDGRLVRVKGRAYKAPAQTPVLNISRETAMQSAALTEGITAIIADRKADAWEWFPVPANNGYELHPAWRVKLSGQTEAGAPLELDAYIDATNGALLYRVNEATDVDVQVKGAVYKNGTASPQSLEPLGEMEVVIGGNTYNLNDTGFISNAANTGNITFRLKGLWSNINPSATPTFIETLPLSSNQYLFDSTGTSNSRVINAYYHVNRVHAHLKKYQPTFVGMDYALITNVDITSGTCNAFFTPASGTSINFYAAAGNCKSFAEVNDIVYHEYGHAISSRFYNVKGAGSMRNGALNEGNSDIWAMGITTDSILGRNAYVNGGFIRRYDLAHKVYPQNLIGQVHNDGEIIAGCWYDFAKSVNSFDTMSMIFTATYDDLPDGPYGMEGAVYHDVLISALLNDDDDANLSNGSPHFKQIVTAFANHGIYLYADAVLTHQELAHQPANTPITVNASLNITNTTFFQDLKLMYMNRNKGTWDTVSMTNTGGMAFTAQIPAQPQGSLLDYYFRIYDFLDIPTVVYPKNYDADPTRVQQSTIPYQFAVGVSLKTQVTFEDTASDWQIANNTNDNATTGKWVQQKPVASSYTSSAFGNFLSQTNKDHTTGNGKCLVTGNTVSVSNYTNKSSSDVDGGRTTVISPKFDLTGYVYPIIEYYRWFANDLGGNTIRNDQWRAEIASGTSAIWYPVEVTVQSDVQWRRRIFSPYQYIQNMNDVRIRFTASDNIMASLDDNGDSNVEAAVDDFFIYDGVPTSVSDAILPAKAQVYPNPADEKLMIVLPVAVKGTAGLYDITGKEMAVINLNASQTQYSFDTKQLAPGQYMMVIQTDNKTIQSQKVIVKHN